MAWTILDTARLRQIDLFTHMPEKSLEELAAITYTRDYRRGEKIFSDGDQGEAMYTILKGEVRISKSIPGLGEEALAILKEGHYFGEMALLDDEPRSADAWAGSTCLLSVISKTDLLMLTERSPSLEAELLRSFVRTLSRRLREANSKVTFLAAAGKF